MGHDLIKTQKSYFCTVCQWNWKSKPTIACPGVRRFPIKPDNLYSLLDLSKLNLMPEDNAQSIGCLLSGSNYQFFYSIDETQPKNTKLPTVINSKDKGQLKTKDELRKLGLQPAPDCQPMACYAYGTTSSNEVHFALLYDPLDCIEGMKEYDWNNRPSDLYSPYQLIPYNRKPKQDASPLGCIYRYKDGEWLYLYALEDTEIDDPDLPPVVGKENTGEFKTLKQLEALNLIPKPNAIALACYHQYYKDFDYEFIPLYHPDDCVWQAKDHFICKTTLKKTYLMSESWIERLGSPDRSAPNPHRRRGSDIKLYSRMRVEAFLAAHAQEYAQWLTVRDRYLEIAERCRPKREAAQQERHRQKQLISDQMTRCFQCASGASTGAGFLCAVHPMGFRDLPCPDYS